MERHTFEEVNSVDEPSKKAAHPKSSGAKLDNPTDVNFTIAESCAKLSEAVMHYGSHVDRINNTIEMEDYYDPQKVVENRCYDLIIPDWAEGVSPPPSGDASMEDLIHYVHHIDPTMVEFTDLSQLDEEVFARRENPRPTGYSAATRLHMGRLCVPILNDSGASCSCITEEQLVLIINHSQRMKREGKMIEQRREGREETEERREKAEERTEKREQTRAER